MAAIVLSMANGLAPLVSWLFSLPALTPGSPCDSGRAGMAPAKLHRRRLARRRLHSRRQLSMYKIAMGNATIYLLVIFCKSVFSNQMSKALVLNFRPLHFFSELQLGTKGNTGQDRKPASGSSFAVRTFPRQTFVTLVIIISVLKVTVLIAQK